MHSEFAQIAVIGAGAMGRGIAQIAAQAGSQVWLYDAQTDAAQKAKDAVFLTWESLQTKGRLTSEQVDHFKSNVHVAKSIVDFRECNLVVEAIVERLDIKIALFRELEE